MRWRRASAHVMRPVPLSCQRASASPDDVPDMTRVADEAAWNTRFVDTEVIALEVRPCAPPHTTI